VQLALCNFISVLLQLFDGAGQNMGWGDLVFTDPTTKRFISAQIDVFGSELPQQCFVHSA
jgi:hypothetical protein